MNLRENISLAIAGLRANKMRAFLTMLGIIIGISSVIMITTLGGVMTSSVNSSFAEMGGTNAIQFYLQEKEDVNNASFSDEDLFSDELIESIHHHFSNDIKYTILQNNIGQGTTLKNRKEYKLDIAGVNEDGIPSQPTYNLLEGRNFNENDIKSEKNVIIITDKLANNLFPNQSAVGKKINLRINNAMQTYSIIGILEYKMSKMSTAMMGAAGEDVSTWAMIPVTTANRLVDNDNIYFSFFFYTFDGVDLNKVADNICKYMNKAYYRNNLYFEVATWIPQDELSTMNDVLGIVSLVISIIAGISLMVGGIGVMNIMLVSVTERTREIGVRKALGAPNSAIRVQFIVESIIICLIGGVIGIIFGVLTGNLIGLIIGEMAAPSIAAIIVAVTFSMAIGVFFGYYPANKAAKLDPIEALRYE